MVKRFAAIEVTKPHRQSRPRAQGSTRRLQLTRVRYLLLGSLAFIAVFALWCVLSYGQIVKPYFLPTPSAVMRALITLFREHELLTDIKISFFRVMAGFLLAAVLAVPLGILMGTFKTVEALVEPINDFIRYMPVPAFIPLVILWIGLGSGAQIALIFLGTFFQLVILVMDVVSEVPKEYLELSSTYGAKTHHKLRDIILPASLPGIYDSLRVSVGWAWSYLVLAEIVAANDGVGHMIMEAQRYLQTDNVIAGILIVGFLGLSLDYIFKAAYKPLFRWVDKEGL